MVMPVNNLAFLPFQGESPVDNFLSSYAKGQDLQAQRATQERNKVVNQRQDQAYEQDQHARAIDQLGAALDGVPDGDQQGFERVKGWAVQNGILDPNEAQRYTVEQLPQIRALSKQARELKAQRDAASMGERKFALDERQTNAQIRASDASANASNANAAYIRSGKTAAGGKVLSSPLQKELGSLGDQSSQVNNSIAGFKDEYASRGFMGFGAETMNEKDRLLGGSEASNWWQSYDRYKNVVRNELFGASLTPGEKASFEAADITPGMNPATIRANLATQLRSVQGALARRANAAKAQGYNPEAIDYLTGPVGEAPQENAAPPSFTRGGAGVFSNTQSGQPVAPGAAQQGGWSVKRVQ
jgi:hypothetical protein